MAIETPVFFFVAMTNLNPVLDLEIQVALEQYWLHMLSFFSITTKQT